MDMAGPSNEFDRVFSSEIDKLLHSDSDGEDGSENSSDCGWVIEAENADIRNDPDGDFELFDPDRDNEVEVSGDDYFNIDQLIASDSDEVGMDYSEINVGLSENNENPAPVLEEIGQGDGPHIQNSLILDQPLVLEHPTVGEMNVDDGVEPNIRGRITVRGRTSGRGRARGRGGRPRSGRGRQISRPRCGTNKWKWNDVNNVPKDIPFIGQPGLNPHSSRKLGNDPTAYQCFSEFVGDEFFEMLCVETNDYAAQHLHNPTRPMKAYEDSWKPVQLHEMKAYIALYMLMGQVKKGAIQEYWSKRKIIETSVFSEVMSFIRFNQISRFLHFSDSNFTESGDKLKKLRPVIKYLENKFQRTLSMEKNVSIDESLVKLRARLSYIQYNPKKRARFGVKIYKICESPSGYCAGFKIYVGDDKTPEMPASSAVVLHLAEPFLNLGHVIYMDNWYTSPDLCKTLLANNTHVVGTANQTRRNMPEDFGDTAYQLEVGDAVRRSVDGILAIQWKDRKVVQVLSTIHVGIEMTVAKEKTVRGEVIQVIKPKSVVDYNNGMLGIDVQDQRLASFPIMRRTIKAYKKIFFIYVTWQSSIVFVSGGK